MTNSVGIDVLCAILVIRDPSTCLNSIRKAAVAEEGFKNRVHKSFYTNVPNEFMKNVEQLIVKSIGFDFESEREHYHVKVLLSIHCSVTSYILTD